jgi:hypothetical protein
MKQSKELSEDVIQAEIFKFYHNKFCTKLNKVPHVIFSVPNGGLRNKREALKLKSTGLVAGVSDLIIVTDKEVLFVEVKTSTGRQSDNQKDFERKVKELGYRYLIVRSLNDFKIQLKIK